VGWVGGQLGGDDRCRPGAGSDHHAGADRLRPQRGGADVDVYSVLKPNVDPTTTEPTPADLEAVADADVVVKNGVGLEKWFEDTIASAEPKAPSSTPAPASRSATRTAARPIPTSGRTPATPRSW
jgi:hypothetical protein